MAQTQEALTHAAGEAIDYTPGSALSAGQIVQIKAAGGRSLVGVATTAIATSVQGALQVKGLFKVKTGSVTFLVGEEVWWDDTNNTAVVAGDANADFYLGIACPLSSGDSTTASTSGTDDYTVVALNEGIPRGSASLEYSSIAESAEVENTTTETAFDKSYTIPANTLKAGDILRVKACAFVVDNNSTDTLTLRLKIGSTTIIATAAVDVADNDVGLIEADILIRTIGGSGTLVAYGTQGLGVPGTVTAKLFRKASTAVDTTATQAITVTAEWSVAHADNEVSLTALVVEHITP